MLVILLENAKAESFRNWTAIFLIIVAAFLFLRYHFVNAPDGWQDENGFHLGKESEKDLIVNQEGELIELDKHEQAIS